MSKVKYINVWVLNSIKSTKANNQGINDQGFKVLSFYLHI